MISSLSEGAVIPDVHLSAVGIHLDLTNLQLHTFKFTGETFQLQEPWRISITMTGIYVNISMNWRYKDGPGIDLSGYAEDIISSTNANIVLRLTSAGGKLQINADSVSVSIGNLDIHLYGGSASFYQTIVNMFKGLIKSEFEKAISSHLQSTINGMASQLLATVPTVFALDPKMDFDVSLISESATHGLHGCYYGNCVFGGGCSDLTQTTFGDIHLSNYHSIDVSGFFRAPASGNYEFQTHYTQRCQLDVNGKSIGSTEPHNPGMCWPQHHTDSTGPMALEEGKLYPIRLRYQAGCGGGSTQLNVQYNGGGFQPVDVLTTYTAPASEMPVIVGPTWIQSASTGVMRLHAGGEACPSVHHVLPATPFVDHPSAMLEAYFDEYVLNSVGWTVAQAGYLNVHVTQDMLPPQVPFSLNTSDFSELIPGLATACPDCAMTMDIFPHTVPEFQLTTTGVTLSIPLALNISYVSPRTQSAVSSVTLGIPIFAEGVAAATPDSRLVGKLTGLTCPLSVLWSAVGSVDTEAIQGLLDMIVEMVGMPMINDFLQKGLPIPVIEGIGLVNPAIQYYNGYLCVASEFGYTPSRRL